MTERVDVITSDGTVHNLDRLVAQGVDGITGVLAVPGKRGTNLVIPGSHGELHLPAKKHTPTNLVLPLWVRGVNPDGSIPGMGDPGARLVFHEHLRELVALFTVDEQVTLRHTLSDGSAREITGEVTDQITPEVRGAGRYTLGQLGVALNCAYPFWTDTTPVSSTATSGSDQALAEFDGASAPIENLLITFGPNNNPKLEQPSTGIFVKLNRVIAAGQTVTVNTETWEVYGSGGVAPGLYEDLEYGGRGTTRWFALHPQPGGPPVVKLTNTGTSGSVTVTGKRTYKIG